MATQEQVENRTRNCKALSRSFTTFKPEHLLKIISHLDKYVLPFDLNVPLTEATIIKRQKRFCLPVCALNSVALPWNPKAFGPLMITIGSVDAPATFYDAGLTVEEMDKVVLKEGQQLGRLRFMDMVLPDKDGPLAQLIRNMENTLFEMWNDAASRHRCKNLSNTELQRSIIGKKFNDDIVSVNIVMPMDVQFMNDEAYKVFENTPEFYRQDYPANMTKIDLYDQTKRSTFPLCDIRPYLATKNQPNASFEAFGTFEMSGMSCADGEGVSLDLTAVRLYIVPKVQPSISIVLHPSSEKY